MINSPYSGVKKILLSLRPSFQDTLATVDMLLNPSYFQDIRNTEVTPPEVGCIKHGVYFLKCVFN